jgi:hypothetical protein
MSEEGAHAIRVGVGVAATCIGVLCSVYHCCCHVLRRLRGHVPATAIGAAAAVGAATAGLAHSSGGQPGSVDTPARCSDRNTSDSCTIHIVSNFNKFTAMKGTCN